MIDQRFRDHSKRKKKAMATARRLKTIAGRLVRNVEGNLDDKERLEAYDEQLWLHYRILGQRGDSHNKIYSFHAPEVSCISKGKDHKKYEFSNKSGFVIIMNSGIIPIAMAFEGNPYDGHTLESQLEQVSDLIGRLPRVALADRGLQGAQDRFWCRDQDTRGRQRQNLL